MQGQHPGAVLACCQEEVKRNGMPYWMRVNQGSCNKHEVRCSKQQRRCWYKPLSFAQIDNNDRDSSRGKR